MSRVIKFRAWDTSDPERPHMLGPYDLTDSIFSYKGVRELPLMQFTGLLDKNGKEIFEGDLMRFFDKTVAVIVFESFGGWCFKWIDQTYKNVRQQNPEPIFRNINLFEVVGNIHENPELL